jgi:hypothetical protein
VVILYIIDHDVEVKVSITVILYIIVGVIILVTYRL